MSQEVRKNIHQLTKLDRDPYWIDFWNERQRSRRDSEHNTKLMLLLAVLSWAILIGVGWLIWRL